MPILEQFTSNEDQNKAILESEHPLYAARKRIWQLGLDAYDGSGGFLTGDHLWSFARERADEFEARRSQARYHEYAGTIIDIYTRSLLEGVERATTDPRLKEWWANIDGRNTAISEHIAHSLVQALAGGHAGILVDRTPFEPTGPTVADDPNRIILSTYASVDLVDWRTDRQGLAAIKLHEDRPVARLDAPIDASTRGWLLWDRDSWARFDAGGEIAEFGDHALGVVPFVLVRPIPSVRHRVIGRALVNPTISQAIYNRGSEEDVVLRDQAFSLFVVALPPDTDDETMSAVERRLAQGVGTTTALVVKGATEYRTADMAVPAEIRASQSNLVKELFRSAYVRFNRDTREAESGEAISLQRRDLDQALKSMAESMQRVELEIVRRYFGWRLDTADQRRITAEMDRADVQIDYPRDFSAGTLTEELESLQAAMALQLGPTATREIKRRGVTLVLPDLAEQTLQAVEEELERSAEGLTAPGQGAAQRIGAGLAERLRANRIEVQGVADDETAA